MRNHANHHVESLKFQVEKIKDLLEREIQNIQRQKSIFLFQQCKKMFVLDGTWYDNKVVGVNTIANFMKTISMKAELSQIFTNHSITATSITVLDECGVEE